MLLAACLAALPAARDQAGEQPRKQTFKAGVNFVRVDAYPSANGRIVPDLKQDEFELLEDGVPQRIEMFERVVVRAPGPDIERAEPRTFTESTEAASSARNRVFVLFLDTYHTSVDSTMISAGGSQSASGSPAGSSDARLGVVLSRHDSRIGRALVAFLDRLIGPDDLIGLFRPEEPIDTLTFTRRPDSFDDFLLNGVAWERRFVNGDFDAQEQVYRSCYGVDSPVAQQMIARRRERIVLSALRALVVHLQNVREERKAILVVSEGWQVFRPDPTLRGDTAGSTRTGSPAGAPVGTTSGSAAGGHPSAECERDRTLLADLDDARDFRALADEANRSNASFYPIDPRGLPVFDSPIGQMEAPPADARALGAGLDSLRTLAGATDGVAIVNSNELSKNLARITDDTGSYYLLGYNPTNLKHDGRFRAIAVRVKRPGVTVRARRGYLAPTEAEIAARARTLAPPNPEATPRENALSMLGTERRDQPFHLMAGFGYDPAAGDATRRILWVVGELDPATARTVEWSGGADATIVVNAAGGQAVATERTSMTDATRRFLVLVAGAPLSAGEYVVHVRVTGKAGGVADAGADARVTVPDARSADSTRLGQAMLFRRGPFTGAGWQPTADRRFRRAERIRVDVATAVAGEEVTARLLDRNGHQLPIPVTSGGREDGSGRFATAEIALAPLAPGDYLVEVAVARDGRTDKAMTAFRIVP